MNWSEFFKDCWQLCRCFARVNVQTSTVLMMGLWRTHSLRTLASLCKLSTHKTHCFTRFRVRTLLILKIHILRDKMLHHWASDFWYFKEPQCLQLQDQEVPRPYSPSHQRQDVLQNTGKDSPTSTASQSTTPKHSHSFSYWLTLSRNAACMKRSVVLLHRLQGQ